MCKRDTQNRRRDLPASIDMLDMDLLSVPSSSSSSSEPTESFRFFIAFFVDFFSFFTRFVPLPSFFSFLTAFFFLGASRALAPSVSMILKSRLRLTTTLSCNHSLSCSNLSCFNFWPTFNRALSSLSFSNTRADDTFP